MSEILNKSYVEVDILIQLLDKLDSPPHVDVHLPKRSNHGLHVEGKYAGQGESATPDNQEPGALPHGSDHQLAPLLFHLQNLRVRIWKD